MIDLTKKALPNTILVGGRAFSINTDYRIWMRFEIELLNSNGKDLDVSYIFRSEMPHSVYIPELLAFSRPKDILPRDIGGEKVVAYDFEYDSDYIYAAFMGQYGIDLLDIDNLHWHKFLALFKGLNESTRLREIMGYRCYSKSEKKDIDQYEKLRMAWAIERETPEEKESTDKFLSYFEG